MTVEAVVCFMPPALEGTTEEVAGVSLEGCWWALSADGVDGFWVIADVAVEGFWVIADGVVVDGFWV